MECAVSPGPSRPSTDNEVVEVLNALLDDVVHIGSPLSLDSPSFSNSSFSGENMTTSSGTITDQEIPEVVVPVKKKRGRPSKNRDIPTVPTSKKTAPRRKRKLEKDEDDYIPLIQVTPRKRGRPPKASTSLINGEPSRSFRCLSQKISRRQKFRDNSPDPFADDDEEFERVTKKMTPPRKRAIEQFHDGTIFIMNHTPRSVGSGLSVMPISLISKYYGGIPDACDVNFFHNESEIFKE